MITELQSLRPNQVYHLMIQTLIPRPIAWVLSKNSDGGLNLAPFSYFNCVCSRPALMMISVGRKPDGSLKDTWRNILERGDHVIHIPRQQDVENVSLSSGTYPENESEVNLTGMVTVEVPGWPLPRIEGPQVAYACNRYEIHEFGDPTRAMILGEVHSVYVADSAIRDHDAGRVSIDPAVVDPLGRLGGNGYSGLGSLHDVPRPK